MSLELWGISGEFHLGLPLRPIGYVLLTVEILLLLVFFFASSGESPSKSRRQNAPGWSLFLFLLLIAPIASEVFLIRLENPEALAAPGIPRVPEDAALTLFGAVPWVFAAGLLGSWQAMAVGFSAGLARGGWETFSLLTPFSTAAQAGLFAWLVRQNYLGWPGRFARRPMVAGVLAGLVYGWLRGLEVVAFSGGGLYDGLGFAASQISPIMAAAVMEAAIAGGLAQVIRSALAEVWYQPARLVAGPYNRTLAARMVTAYLTVGMLASGVILYGSWLQASSSARELVESRMSETATLAGESVPFFVQTGRSYVRQIAVDMKLTSAEENLLSERLAPHLRFMPFFSRLVVFGPDAAVLAGLPEESFSAESLPLPLETGLETVLKGVPQEVILIREEVEPRSQVVFLAPIISGESGAVLGAVAGWTDLRSNPLISPAVRLLSEWSPGEAFIIDEAGVILFHPDLDGKLGSFSFRPESGEQVYVDTAPDGTRQLVLASPVSGYSWRVVVTIPMREVDRIALGIAFRLFGVVAAVGVLVIALGYVSSRRLARPLVDMAEIAESIARGELDRAVPLEGEDEIGRLSRSFEKMRLGLQARLTEMDLLLHTSRQLASSFELSVLLPPILSVVQRHVGADVVRLVLTAIEADTDEVEVYTADLGERQWHLLDSQMLGLAQEQGQFFLENPARARAVLDFGESDGSLEALLALPIKNEGAFLGVLWIAHSSPHIPSPEEGRLLKILAVQLGVSIANTRLYFRVEAERRRLGAILEATPDAIVVVDRHSRITLANPASTAILRVPAQDAVGALSESVLVSPEVAELLRFDGEASATAEIDLPDGRVLFASTRDIPAVKARSGGRVCVLGDITHYKRLDKLKSDFVSTVSHDLKAPLTLTRGYAKMLSMVGALNGQQKEFVQKILGSVDHMTQLVDNLLDLGRIEAGIALNVEPVEVEDVVQDVIGAYRPQAISRQIALEVALDTGLETIVADPTLLRQAIANLIDNALKYTDSGGKVVLRAKQAGGKQLIEVEDNGLGVAPTDTAKLFEKFFRARRRETLGAHGTGLGLSIVKSIVEQHGGTVSVDSRLGEGSTFRLELPMEPERSKVHP